MLVQEQDSELIACRCAEFVHGVAAVDRSLPFSPFPKHSLPEFQSAGIGRGLYSQPRANAPSGRLRTRSRDVVPLQL